MARRCVQFPGSPPGCDDAARWTHEVDLAAVEFADARRIAPGWWVRGRAFLPSIEPSVPLRLIDAPLGWPAMDSRPHEVQELRSVGFLMGSLERVEVGPLQVIYGSDTDAEQMQELASRLSHALQRLPFDLGSPPVLIISAGTSNSRAAQHVDGALGLWGRFTDAEVFEELLQVWLRPAPIWLAGGLARVLRVFALGNNQDGRFEVERWYREHRASPPRRPLRESVGLSGGLAGALALFCADLALQRNGSSLIETLEDVELRSSEAVLQSLGDADALAAQRLRAQLEFRGVIDIMACLEPAGLQLVATVAPRIEGVHASRVLQANLRGDPPVVAARTRRFREGDQVVRVRGMPIASTSELSEALRGLKPREAFAVTVQRGEDLARVWLRLPRLPDEIPKRVVYFFEATEEGRSPTISFAPQ